MNNEKISTTFEVAQLVTKMLILYSVYIRLQQITNNYNNNLIQVKNHGDA
ncbi:hypothetical protein H1P_470018 [Hyella patelloides LEGE 07179]|uniref:Uncharacterized protein n=1 Tax=Hyella patelloides LEGE 07179 TaxID=945734 RepID=A0A563VYY0_9CYAN|nr:hypothetical protein H1P_470018 [Hyella patelloides LEGE 07179]